MIKHAINSRRSLAICFAISLTNHRLMIYKLCLYLRALSINTGCFLIPRVYCSHTAKQDVFAACLSTLCTSYETVSTNLQPRSDGINRNDLKLRRFLPPQDCNDISTIQGSTFEP